MRVVVIFALLAMCFSHVMEAVIGGILPVYGFVYLYNSAKGDHLASVLLLEGLSAYA